MAAARDRILASARALYLEGGVEAVTMRSVAERVGVTATALYRHFDGKEDLIGEVITGAFETFGSYLYRSLDGRTPMERFTQSGEAYLDFALEQREIYRTIFMTPIPKRKGADEPAKRRQDPHSTFQFLMDRIRECMEAGDLRRDDPEAVALSVWAHNHGLVSLHICGTLGLTDEEFREAFRGSVDRLMAGLATGNKKKGS